MGWFTLGAASGPEPHILPIHSRISELYTESPLLVLFHPEGAFSEATAAGKLPLTVYESLSVNTTTDPNDKAMDIDGAVQAKSIKFRELVYSIETGEAEMISVDFVARGGGNATAVEGSTDAQTSRSESGKADEASGKRTTRGKQKEKESDKATSIDETAILTAEDDESMTIPVILAMLQLLTVASTFLANSQDERYPYARSTYWPSTCLSRYATTIISSRRLTACQCFSRCAEFTTLRPHNSSQCISYASTSQHPRSA